MAIVTTPARTTADDLWRETGRNLLRLKIADPAKWKDFEFAEQYLKGTSAFPDDTAARWFDPSPSHLDLTNAADQTTRILIQFPREFSKSSIFSFIRPLRLLCEDRRRRIVIISKTKDAAMRFVNAIRKQLETNERILHDFGAFKGHESWTDEAFTVIRDADYKEPSVQAVGRGGQIVSGRYEYVVLDDTEDYESTRVSTRRVGTYHWFLNDVVPVVVSGGQLIVIQTPQHETDLVGQMRKHPAWKIINIPCEHEEPDPEWSVTACETTRRQPVDGVCPEHGDAKCLVPPRQRRVAMWPEKWPIYWTDCNVKKAEARGASETAMAQAQLTWCPQCPIFDPSLGDTGGRGCLTGKRWEVGDQFYSLQYKVQISALGGVLWRNGWFARYRRSELKYENRQWIYTPADLGGRRRFVLEIYMGVDPAIADEEEEAPEDKSEFGLVVLGYVRALGRRLILYAYGKRIDFPTQQRVLHEQYVAWNPVAVIPEEIQYQRALRQQLIKDFGRMRFEPRKHQDADKYRRFSALTPEFKALNVYLLEEPGPGGTWNLHPDHDVLRGQMVNFPNAAHDDLIDAYDLSQDKIDRLRPLQGLAEEERKRIEQVNQCMSVQEALSDEEPPARQGKAWTVSDIIEANLA